MAGHASGDDKRPIWQYVVAILIFVGAGAFAAYRIFGDGGDTSSPERKAALEAERHLKDEAAKSNVGETAAPEMTPPPTSKPGRGPQ